MEIDTRTIQRVRDALLERGRTVPGADGENLTDHPVPFGQDLLERFTPFAETMFIVAMVDGTDL